MNPSRWRAGALLGGAFVAGVACGIAFALLLGHRWMHRPPGPRSPDRAVEFLSRRLNLRPAQKDSVRAILERRRPALDSLWKDFNPRFAALRRGFESDISAQLDSTQRAKFEELSRRMERMHPPGPPGSPPPH